MTYKLKENEVFCCNMGCGVCNTYQDWSLYEELISACGNYRETKEKLTTVSECCGCGVFVWNTILDDEVDCDLP